MRARQCGAGGVLIAVVLVLLVLVLLAARVLSRLGDAGEDKNTTVASLARAKAALDQFVAAGGASARLPCPADPTQDTGLENPTPATGTCNSATGTLPWRTIGLRRDDGYDAWGRKLSYRVYTGNKGSLVQAGGPAMLNCYYDREAEALVGFGTTSTGACKTDHSTTHYDFLTTNGKGLKLFDMGAEFSSSTGRPVAYVVISHGPTGFGGYTVSGAQLSLPIGDERDNTRDTGPFHIDAWSDPDTAATSAQHFDDLLAYRTIRDLVMIAGTTGRKWAGAPVLVANAPMDAATLTPALAAAAASNGGSTAVADLGAVTASGFSGSTATNLVLDTTNFTEGLGVGGGFDNQISSTSSESIKLKLDHNKTGKSMAITLNNFGTYLFTFFGTYTYTERVQLTFSRSGTTVDTKTFSACNTGQGVVTYKVTPAAEFDTVVVAPLSAVPSPAFFAGDTSFSIGAFAACSSLTCATSITTSTTCS